VCRSLTRSLGRAKRIQAYARKYDITHVVNELLQFSLDVGRDAGTLIPGEVLDTAALAEETAAKWRFVGTMVHVLLFSAVGLRWWLMRGREPAAAAAPAAATAASEEGRGV